MKKKITLFVELLISVMTGCLVFRYVYLTIGAYTAFLASGVVMGYMAMLAVIDTAKQIAKERCGNKEGM